MLDRKILRNNIHFIADKLALRGFTFEIEKVVALESQRKLLQTEVQKMEMEINNVSNQVALAKKENKTVDSLVNISKEIELNLQTKRKELETVTSSLDDIYSAFPNIPHASVPEGVSEVDNVEIRKFGLKTEFGFQAKDHVELGENLKMLDIALAAKISGSRFAILKSDIAKLHRSIGQFMLDLHTKEHAYKEMYVPYLVNKNAMFGTGQLPKFLNDQFAVSNDTELFLIPTAEVSLTNIVSNAIVNEEALPLKYTALTPCFRKESGSYGKDTRGIFRLHQFEKVELVQITHPEFSYKALDELVNHAEIVLQKLNLPYRVVALCVGDLGFASAKTYDIEVWLPGQKLYREISSCSNFESFQARRMQARYKSKNGKSTEYVHTINGSGLAVGRTLIAIMENFQDEKGNIHIPEVLQSYMNGQTIIDCAA